MFKRAQIEIKKGGNFDVIKHYGKNNQPKMRTREYASSQVIEAEVLIMGNSYEAAFIGGKDHGMLISGQMIADGVVSVKLI